MKYYLENGKQWLPVWHEQEDGGLIREHPLKNDGSVDWDLDNKQMNNPIPEKDEIVIPNEKLIYKAKTKNLGRNEKCYCGSGKKFKKCCLVL